MGVSLYECLNENWLEQPNGQVSLYECLQENWLEQPNGRVSLYEYLYENCLVQPNVRVYPCMDPLPPPPTHMKTGLHNLKRACVLLSPPPHG